LLGLLLEVLADLAQGFLHEIHVLVLGGQGSDRPEEAPVQVNKATELNQVLVVSGQVWLSDDAPQQTFKFARQLKVGVLERKSDFDHIVESKFVLKALVKGHTLELLGKEDDDP